jgi:hypothetical protein
MTVGILSLMMALVVCASAQKMLQNPSYLSQFPTPDRIKTEMKTADAVDSYARFMAALDVINGFMLRDLLQAPNGGYYEMPPAAERVQQQYGNALTKYSIDSPEPPAKDPRYRELRDNYDKDAAFLDMLLTEFFSAQFRSDYYAWTRKPMPISAARTNSASADPSIAKAKAAKVDISAFGMQLGQPLDLPTCQDSFTQMDRRMCVYDPRSGPNGAMLDFLSSIIPNAVPAADPNIMQVRIDQDHCPGWVANNCGAQVLMHDGVLVAIAVATGGRNVENAVNAELKAKYGPPTSVNTGTITKNGSDAFGIKDPEWALPGLHVEYQVVNHTDLDNVNAFQGWLRVATESAYNRLKNPPVKRKM